MKNSYLTPFTIEELEQRKEFVAVDGLVSCAFNKCFNAPMEDSYL
ncbi:hypothetical protein [Flavobacterium sp. GCM10023249]